MLPIPICVPDKVKEMVYLLPGQKPTQKDLTMENSGESSLMVPMESVVTIGKGNVTD